jgi:hypothetical protein
VARFVQTFSLFVLISWYCLPCGCLRNLAVLGQGLRHQRCVRQARGRISNPGRLPTPHCGRQEHGLAPINCRACTVTNTKHTRIHVHTCPPRVHRNTNSMWHTSSEELEVREEHASEPHQQHWQIQLVNTTPRSSDPFKLLLHPHWQHSRLGAVGCSLASDSFKAVDSKLAPGQLAQVPGAVPCRSSTYCKPAGRVRHPL